MPPTVVHEVSGTAKVAETGLAFGGVELVPSSSIGPICTAIGDSTRVPSSVFDANSAGVTVPDTVSPICSRPRLSPVLMTDAGTLTVQL